MNRLFGKLHINALIQPNSVFSRDLATASAASKKSAGKPPVILPKRTPNGWNLFVKSKIQQGTVVTNQIKDIAQQWKSTSEAEKMKFNEEATKLRKQSEDAFKKLSQKEQDASFEKAKQQRNDLKKFRRLSAYRAFRKDTQCPHRPISPALAYRIEKNPHPTKDQILSDAKKYAEEFKNLSDAEKKPYNDRYQEQLKAYKAELEKWMAKHGDKYEQLKKQFSPPKKVKAKTGRKTSTGLYGRLKKRSTQRKTMKVKKSAKTVARRH